MNSNEMKAVMKREGDTQKDLAEALGLPVSGVNARINGSVDFRASEIVTIRKRYNLTDQDIGEIFFNTDAS